MKVGEGRGWKGKGTRDGIWKRTENGKRSKLIRWRAKDGKKVKTEQRDAEKGERME